MVLYIIKIKNEENKITSPKFLHYKYMKPNSILFMVYRKIII
jgi:hypothetical protein